MRRRFALAAAFILAAPAIAPALAVEDVEGNWKRPNGDTVTASVVDGKLNCAITAGSYPGFEMCHGMVKQGDAWTGSAMKHPDMASMLSFNGTVIVFGEELKIKGCAMGDAFCDSETWTRAQ